MIFDFGILLSQFKKMLAKAYGLHHMLYFLFVSCIFQVQYLILVIYKLENSLQEAYIQEVNK